MKNILFRKAAALVMGSLFAFCGTAFASTDKIGKISHVTRGGNSEILIAQSRVYCQGSLRNLRGLLQGLAIAETSLGNAIAANQSDAILGTKKGTLAKLITKARELIEQAYALSCSSNIADKKAVAKLLTEAETVLDDAFAMAQSEAIRGPGKSAIAQSLASAKTSVGNLAAIAKSSVQ
ncbi:MAG: hypothetical protein RMX68_003895 [Aulosira sp. ZfuVER01]|nr:hypothetical protein [Aulosira sp. ZfuVER01]MDZ7999939.1 hypothetical protein [Aulosira sp. DedVER01a]MDZ8051377.1 hypothetical protein [Aulosira sp. ZfuCHP01]